MTRWYKRVLTGQSDNWWAIGGNIVLSCLPDAGVLLDLITLFTDPVGWVKAMALIGVVASVLSDGAEVLTAIGAAIPPTLAATVPGAALLEAIDVGADVLGHLAKRAWKATETWPGSEVFSLIQSVLSSVWDPFVALLTHYEGNLARLFERGFGDGGFLAGRVLKLSDEVDEQAVKRLISIGDKWGEALTDLSDDGVKGLARLDEALPDDRLPRLLENLCPGGVAYLGHYRGPGLASPLPTGTCQIKFKQITELVSLWCFWLHSFCPAWPSPTRPLAGVPARPPAHGGNDWIIWEMAQPPQSLLLDGDTLWVGSYKGGLYRWDVAGGYQAHYTAAAGLRGGDIAGLALAGSGHHLAAAVDGGLAIGGTAFSDVTPLGGERAWDVAGAGADTWLATLGGGLAHRSSGTWTTYTSAHSGLATPASTEKETLPLKPPGYML